VSTTQAATSLRISSIPRARWGMIMVVLLAETHADRLCATRAGYYVPDRFDTGRSS